MAKSHLKRHHLRELCEAYRRGDPVEQIARGFSLSTHSIWYYQRKFNLRRRPKRVEKTCPCCGNTFIDNINRSKPKTYCTLKCQRRASSRLVRGRPRADKASGYWGELWAQQDRHCLHCNKLFTPRHLYHAYCRHSCRTLAYYYRKQAAGEAWPERA